MPSTIVTGITGTGWEITGAQNTRALHRTAAGRAWALYLDGNAHGASLKYSDDDTTWVDPGTGWGTYPWHATAFLDIDGNMHAIGREPSFGGLFYARGVPNGNGWTWQGPLSLGSYVNGGPMAMVAHREGTGWAVHIAFFDGLLGFIYIRVGVSASGVQSAIESRVVPFTGVAPQTLAMDFNHVGDGKTVKGVPHLYLASANGSTVEYVKATYSGGTWSWPAAPQIAATDCVARGISAVFDGTRFLMLYLDSATTLKVVERDAGDTTNTPHVLPTLSDGNVESWSIACDQFGDFYVAAAGASSHDAKITKYTRQDDAFSAWATVEATTVKPASLNLMAVGDTQVRGIYTVGTGPFDVHYANFASTNVAPDAPLWIDPNTFESQAHDVDEDLVMELVFSDRNTGDTMSATAIHRHIDLGPDAGDKWYDGTDFTLDEETWIDPITVVTVPAGWAAEGDFPHVFFARTKDAEGLAGIEGYGQRAIPSAKHNPVIDSPDEQVTATRTLTATVDSVTAFLAELLVNGAVVDSSGWKTQTTSPISWTFGKKVDNGTSPEERLTTRNKLPDGIFNATGLPSDPISHVFHVSYTPPEVGVLSVAKNTPRGAVTVSVTNPAVGPVVDHSELYRRIAGRIINGAAVMIPEGERGDGIRRKADLPINGSYVEYRVQSGYLYEWQAVTVAVSGAVAVSAWTL